MRTFISFCLVVLIFIREAGAADLPLSAADYIALWKNEAIFQMAEHHIPASITLAQGMLESGNGNSRLAKEGNNHFGIKCHADWKGAKIYEDDETRGECFRKYRDARDSYEDHSLFLKRTRYEKLFSYEADDYKSWAKGLKECGYATNPKYPDLLIKIIRENNLEEYDKIGMEYIRKGKLPERPGYKQSDEKEEHLTEKKPRNRVKKHETKSEEPPREITLNYNREVMVSDNRIKYTIAREGDTPASIAKEMEMGKWQIENYNDLEMETIFGEGEKVYLQPKRSKATVDSYVVMEGDNMWMISQKFGIRLKKLYHLNVLEPGAEPLPGYTLRLR